MQPARFDVKVEAQTNIYQERDNKRRRQKIKVEFCINKKLAHKQKDLTTTVFFQNTTAMPCIESFFGKNFQNTHCILMPNTFHQ